MYRSFLLILLWPALNIQAQQAGELDASFANGGKLILDQYRKVIDLAVQEDGEILALTYAGSITDTRVIRLLPTGELDTTFASNGEFAILNGKRVLVQSDGKILLLSSTAVLGAVVRLLQDGSVDTTYSSFPMQLRVTAADLYPDDRLVVAGSYQTGHRMYRLNMDGSLDITFNGTGYISQTYGINYIEEIPGVQIASDASIYFVSKVTQLTPPVPSANISYVQIGYNGAILTGYSVLGSDEGAHTTCPTSLSLTPNGCLFATHDRCEDYPSWLRFTYGSIDNDLYSDDQLMPPWPYSTIGRIGRSASDHEGDLFIPFTSSSAVGASFNICSISGCSGGLSQAWGTNGYVFTEFPDHASAKTEIVIVQPDGKILAGGSVSFPEHFALVRYHNIPDPRSALHLKMFLGGPYNSFTGLMNDHLRQQGQIPFIQPYSLPAYQAMNGIGSWGIGAGVLTVEGDSAIVDRVWLELLSTADTSTVQATRVGLLHRNGSVTQADGISPIDFSVGAGSYFLRVRHRNHLAVTLAEPITLGVEPLHLDLTSPATTVFGEDARMDIDGVMALWPGDVTNNGEVKYIGNGNDRDPILVNIGGNVPTAINTGYHQEDVNMDGIVKYIGSDNDRDIILQVIDGLPTDIRIEQQP